jgi:hypothetical protein
MRIFLLLCLSLLPGLAHAQLFLDGFENRVVERQFPLVGGTYQLPAGPSTTQLNWLLSELAVGQTTTAAEVTAHFDPAWLAQISVSATISFIDSIRTSYPNGRLTDVISVTPKRIVAILSPGDNPNVKGFLQFGSRFAGTALIEQLGVSTFNTVIYAEDASLDATQVLNKFITLAPQSHFLVARINSANQCVVVTDHNANVLGNTASVFKTWVLGSVATSVRFENYTPTTNIVLDGTRNVAGSVIDTEPNGTVFTAEQLAIFMMGNSDNTATDILHQFSGRAQTDQVFTDLGMAQPTVMTPLLGLSEQFHLILNPSISAAARDAYLNGSEAFQQSYLQNTLIPLGRFAGGGVLNPISLLNTHTWRATPMDVCRAMAALRKFPDRTNAQRLIDKAFGAGAFLPGVRNQWDRVWYKGGSLQSTSTNQHVNTNAWMLEKVGRDPVVFVTYSNDPNGGLSTNPAVTPNIFQVNSLLGRMHQLLELFP